MAKDKKDSSKYRKGRTNSGNDSFKDIDNPDEWGSEQHERFVKDLPDFERNGLTVYTGGAYTPINKYLRGNTDYISDSHKQTIDGAKAALDKASLSESVVAHRGFEKFGIFKDLSSIKEGTVYRDPGFTSTSIDPNRAFTSSWSTSNVKVKVFVPKGSKAAYVDKISLNKGERELLIQAGSKFKITKIDAANNYMEVRLLPSKNKSKETSTYEPKFKTK